MFLARWRNKVKMPSVLEFELAGKGTYLRYLPRVFPRRDGRVRAVRRLQVGRT